MLIAKLEYFMSNNFNSNIVLIISIFLFGLSLSYPALFLQALLLLSLYSLIFTTAFVLIKTIMETSVTI